MTEKTKTKSTAASKPVWPVVGVLLGAIGLILCLVPDANNFACFLGVEAAVLGGLGLTRKTSSKTALTALILGALSIIISLGLR